MSVERALDVAAGAAGRAIRSRRSAPSLVGDGQIVGEGATEAGGRHGEIVALAAAGERARGATLYVTMEPCAHHGSTPPCVDAIVAAGVAKVVAGSLDPNPEAAGGLERLRAAGVAVELDDRFEARRQNEAWRRWIARGRPFVTYKAAVTLDGRVTVPGSRWVSGEESRRLVHELRAASDAVAVGMGTVRLDDPRLDARDVPGIATAAPARVRPRPAPGGLGARAPQRPARRGAPRARRRGRPVASPRRRADARRRVPPRRPRRQAPALRRADARRRRARTPRPARAPARAHAADERGRSDRICSSRRISTSRRVEDMFTGLVREIGRVASFDGSRMAAILLPSNEATRPISRTRVP